MLSSNVCASAKEYGFFCAQDAHVMFSATLELDELHHMVTVRSLHVVVFVLFLLRDEEVLMVRLGLRWCSMML